MPYRSLIMAALMAALVFVAFRWYQAEQALAVCRQDMQAAQRLMAFCTPVVQQANDHLFQEEIRALSDYPSSSGNKLADQFRRLDTLFQFSRDACMRADLWTLVHR